MSTATLPYLTSEHPGVSAIYKARWEDFRVNEVQEREPEGTGHHLWMEVEKHGLATPRAASDLARALGVKPSSIGYAGMKDARAIARQWMSVEHVAPERALGLEIPRIRVLQAVRHPRKLRRGWHGGNRFLIRLRPPSGDRPGSLSEPGVRGGSATSPAASAASAWESGPEAVVEEIHPVLQTLAERGVPNYYGPQRFGSRGDTWRVGRALAWEQWDEAAALIAGRPLDPDDPAVDAGAGIHADHGDILRARRLFDAGSYVEAAGTWPRGFGQCARLATAMDRTGGDAARSIPVVGKRMLRLYASAWQSFLFNRVLAVRIGEIDGLREGDLAWKHDTEALFPVGDPARERPRAAAFEISPTGPLVGRRMREPGGEVEALEAAVLRDAGFREASLDAASMRPLTGRRRPLRFALRDVVASAGSDERGVYVELRFALPPGCYATAVLREIGKGRIVEGSPGEAPDPT